MDARASLEMLLTMELRIHSYIAGHAVYAPVHRYPARSRTLSTLYRVATPIRLTPQIDMADPHTPRLWRTHVQFGENSSNTIKLERDPIPKPV